MTATARAEATMPPQKPNTPPSFAAQVYAMYAPTMYSEPCAMLTMRGTPKMSDNPADKKNSDEAFARPLRAWIASTSRGTLLLRRAHLPHFGIGGLNRRTVDELDVDHRALAALDRGLADPRAHRALMVDAAVRDRPGRRVDAQPGERSDQLLGVGPAGLLDALGERLHGDVADQRAKARV